MPVGSRYTVRNTTGTQYVLGTSGYAIVLYHLVLLRVCPRTYYFLPGPGKYIMIIVPPAVLLTFYSDSESKYVVCTFKFRHVFDKLRSIMMYLPVVT